DNEYVHAKVVDDIRPVLLAELNRKPEGILINEFRQLVQATKKICPMLIGIYENEKIITTQPEDTNLRIRISEAGKKML
ncbi:MAG: hypothetical protein ABIJ16_11865, partial [Bacteroidota bacterium]